MRHTSAYTALIRSADGTQSRHAIRAATAAEANAEALQLAAEKAKADGIEYRVARVDLD